MAPLVKAFRKESEIFDTKVCVTGQHREMLDQVLEFFEIVPDFDLNLMKPNQSLHQLTASLIVEIESLISSVTPDYVFVHGDTTTAMATSLASFYNKIPVCHVEAGLRTLDKFAPFPEEINRQFIGKIAEYHFSPTKLSKQNLIDENIDESNILVTGNTVIDALFYSVEKVKINPSKEIEIINSQLQDKRMILVTGHRRENHGVGFVNICKALKKIANKNKDIVIVYPVHLNPNVLNTVNQYLSKVDNIILTKPFSYPDFVWMMNRSEIIITDSGGIQEEAPSLHKPVLVMRKTTERPEALESGMVRLVGSNKEDIYKQTIQLLEDKDKYKSEDKINNPYGDGKASKKIVEFMKTLL